MNNYKQISETERDKIAILKAERNSIRAISRILKRSPSTIHAEIHRNSDDAQYVAIEAERLATDRQSKANRMNPAKDEKIFWKVRDLLGRGWSPEIISGRLMKTEKISISHETIYSYIYRKENKNLQLYEYLPRKQKRRKKKNGRRVHRGHIPNRISIRHRPAWINDRSEFGHWEGDTVEGLGHRDGVHTEVERQSRYLQAEKVAAITSIEGVNAQLKIFNAFPTKATRSTTMDNGRENHSHTLLWAINMCTYFADPYSSWQRGTNEWHNGLLRRYFPKGTDFKKVSAEELKEVVEEINNRPRKVLEFSTPAEVFFEHILT